MHEYTHELEEVHLHIDGSAKCNWNKITAKLSEWDLKYKTSEIRNWTNGPQRSIKPDIYKLHTPEIQGAEDCSFLITVELDAKNTSYVDKITQLRKLLLDYPGSVVEIEKVVALINQREARFTTLSENPVSLPNFVVKQNNLIEIHHKIDIQRDITDSDTKPLDFDRLLELSDKARMQVGGWSLFNKDERWSYRSNSFIELENKEQLYQLQQQYEFFNQLLSQVIPNVSHTMLIEQVLGIWKVNHSTKNQKNLTRKKLSLWEKEFDNLKEFWVVAPNFLGDRFNEFFEAMQHNLWERNPPTEYFYFLRSFTDLQRLRKLVDQLSKNVGQNITQINAVVFWNEKNMSNLPTGIESSFIANPHDFKNRAGYNLDEDNNGIKMKQFQLKEYVDKLNNLKSFNIPSICVNVSRHTHISTDNLCVMRTALINLPSKKDVLINDYDMIIAEEVSKANGHVVNTVELLGYIALFQNPSDAVVCAQTVQQELNESFPNPNNQIHHIVALENGPVKRIWRAHGIDYFGTAIEAVESLAKYAMTKNRSSIVFMSERFRSQWLLATDPNHVNKATNFFENQSHDGTPIWELLVQFKNT